ncbi:DUF443 domain-containing protein [Pseudolactococcus reticulitermitis]|uniref:Uncharacterized protein n=1 Tax=Pseudolactococcus reticulitermitis TaxID=2025039 RepID=A0A224XFS2_9LACT|nr:hypothetical protein [Lactococcus reticulitermitis]GAX48465.1 hypothetical protein RsY01_2094 [Lactococcus reticulitermitis]
MLKFEYSKNTRYLLGKDTNKYYIVDTDSNGILRFFINPSNYYKNIYPITSVEYDKLKKEKITAKDLGIGGVTLLISGSFIGGSLYKMLQALNIKIDIDILVLSLTMFPLVFFYQKIKDYIALKKRDISLNKKEALIAKVIFINEKSRKK